jgi:hypothetical protein
MMLVVGRASGTFVHAYCVQEWFNEHGNKVEVNFLLHDVDMMVTSPQNIE